MKDEDRRIDQMEPDVCLHERVFATKYSVHFWVLALMCGGGGTESTRWTGQE